MRTEFTLSPGHVKKFWSKVDQSGGPDACWPWLGTRSRYGYGMFQLERGSFAPGTSKAARANRVAWFLAYGAIPDGLVIAHRVCDNPPCCNPAHLAAMTQLENIADRNQKGRYDHGPNAPKWSRSAWASRATKCPARGERAARARLTAEQVREIRQRYATEGIGQERLAHEYGVHKYAIWMIVHRKSWRHVE